MRTKRHKIVVRHVGMEQCRNRQGIHLTGPLAPGAKQRARERAERDLFTDIWIHWPNVVNIAHSDALIRREMQS